MLEVVDLDAFYGRSQVLYRVGLTVAEGAVVSVMGRNGAGKSTLLKSLAGVITEATGTVRYGARSIEDLDAYARSRLGIAYVPEDRQVFALLSCRDNLAVAARNRRSGYWTPERVFDLFPRLRERAGENGDTLSGGEQQMLAVGRALVGNPDLLMLDEPTEGLAPIVVETMVNAIRAISREGMSIVLVEQNLRIPLQLATFHYVLENGHIVWSGDSRDAQTHRDVIQAQIAV